MAHSRKYSVDGEQNIASPDDSILGITQTGTVVEPSIFYLAIGCEVAPVDATIIWYLQRHTAAGTSTAVTPQNLGPGTAAASAVGAENHTIEPTFTANAILWRLGLNQRAAHSLVFDPEGCPTGPATANNGITAYPQHASSTVLMSMTMHYRE